MPTLHIRYTIRFGSGHVEVFDVALDEETLEIQSPTPETLPAWTALDFHQCPNCPLDVAEHPHCPLAVAIQGIVSRFEDVISHHEVDVHVDTPERRVTLQTTSQVALSSLMGLVNAASGCPHTAFFKPMARFHLPFASGPETFARAVATYLTAQYLKKQRGEGADLELDGLQKIYETMQVVNTATAQRLRAATNEDASLNAVVRLDSFAHLAPIFIRQALADIRGPYEHYLEAQSED